MQGLADGMVAALLEASPDCVAILDPEGRLREMNTRGRSLLEIEDFERARGEAWVSSWPEADRGRIAAVLEEARAGRGGAFEVERPTAEGVSRRWRTALVPVRDGDGVVTEILASTRDVTPIRRLDGAVPRGEGSRAQTSQIEKLIMLGHFVGSVVHDINNVLASIAGAARLLRRGADDVRTLDILDHFDQAVDKGARLVRRLLDFSRGDADAPEPLDVAVALAADRDLLRHLVGRTVTLELEIEPDLWPIVVAPGRLQAVLFNLVANARDAIEGATGHVRVVARNRPSSTRAAGLPPGDWVEIAVVDDGTGMTPEVVARLGEPFFTTKAAGKGTGLGVSSAFDLADRAGGWAEIESAVGHGSRLSLHLPRATADGASAPPGRASRDADAPPEAEASSGAP